MSKYKAGDKVVLLKDMDYAVKGSILTCVDNYSVKIDYNDFDYSSKFASTAWVNSVPHFFKLAQEKEMFDMKTQPWFIRVNNKEEWEIVQDWLENNFGCAVDCSYAYIIKLVTNVDAVGEIRDIAMWESDVEIKKKQAQEIKLTFKTIIDSVEYPVVKSERDLKIEELEQSIKEAQQRLNELKEMK